VGNKECFPFKKKHRPGAKRGEKRPSNRTKGRSEKTATPQSIVHVLLLKVGEDGTFSKRRKKFRKLRYKKGRMRGKRGRFARGRKGKKGTKRGEF